MSIDPTSAVGHTDQLWLQALGARIRDARRVLRVSVTAAAQAADLSRVTWHRLEAGSGSVSAGAYARALDVLGIATLDEVPQAPERPIGMIPTRIRVGDWPELTALAWSLKPETILTPREALAVYERDERHLDRTKLTEAERALIDDLQDGLADAVRS